MPQDWRLSRPLATFSMRATGRRPAFSAQARNFRKQDVNTFLNTQLQGSDEPSSPCRIPKPWQCAQASLARPNTSDRFHWNSTCILLARAINVPCNALLNLTDFAPEINMFHFGNAPELCKVFIFLLVPWVLVPEYRLVLGTPISGRNTPSVYDTNCSAPKS